MKYTKIEMRDKNVIIEKDAVDCPICGAWMERTHYQNGGVRDNCDHCLFEGVNLTESRYRELIKEIEGHHGED